MGRKAARIFVSTARIIPTAMQNFLSMESRERPLLMGRVWDRFTTTNATHLTRAMEEMRPKPKKKTSLGLAEVPSASAVAENKL